MNFSGRATNFDFLLKTNKAQATKNFTLQQVVLFSGEAK